MAQKYHKKKIKALYHIDVAIPVEFEVNAWDETYDYDFDEVKMEVGKYHPHVEEEYDYSTTDAENQSEMIRKVKQFIKDNGLSIEVEEIEPVADKTYFCYKKD